MVFHLCQSPKLSSSHLCFVAEGDRVVCALVNSHAVECVWWVIFVGTCLSVRIKRQAAEFKFLSDAIDFLELPLPPCDFGILCVQVAPPVLVFASPIA